jgi:hypothetical protein
VLEVHPIDRPDQRRSEQDRRPRRDLLEVVYRKVLTCGNVADRVSGLRRSFFRGCSGSCLGAQSILPTRSPETRILPRFSPEELLSGPGNGPAVCDSGVDRRSHTVRVGGGCQRRVRVGAFRGSAGCSAP